MAKYLSESEKKSDKIYEIYVSEEGKPETKRLTYYIDKQKEEITFYPKESDFFLDKIILEGFKNIPKGFSNKGYITKGLQYYFNKKLDGKSVKKITISNKNDSSFEKINSQNSYHLVLNYEDFKTIRARFLFIENEAAKNKNESVENFLYNLFPENFPEKIVTSKEQRQYVVKNLNSNIIEHLTPQDLERIEGFISDLLEKKYQSNSHKFIQLARTKVKVDTIAIDRILKEFKKNLEEDISENKWGKYLKKNLFLLNSKYVKILPELNVILRGSRNVDFGMIDTKGYLDIFEIKKPSTQLLANATDRGNYYWNTSAVKAIVQAEKYLFNAERKASNLAEDIQREEKISVKVVKPRAVLIMGHSKQLDSEQKKDDFKVLRQSLKNIEIILYDELLEGLENQKNKYFDQIMINQDE